jgi:hypothetical protein
MKNVRLLAYLFLFASLSLALVSCAGRKPVAQGGTSDILYVCGCGESCKCVPASTQPGKCGCGHDRVAGKLKKVEGDTALLCMCGASCNCSLNANDSSKCGCGQSIRKVSLKGTGIYFCNCGGSCACNTVSATPAKCKCGMDLKKSG